MTTFVGKLSQSVAHHFSNISVVFLCFLCHILVVSQKYFKLYHYYFVCYGDQCELVILATFQNDTIAKIYDSIETQMEWLAFSFFLVMSHGIQDLVQPRDLPLQ